MDLMEWLSVWLILSSLLLSCSASDIAYSYTFLRSVVCRSVVCHTRTPCLNCSINLDAIWQVHLWGPMTYGIRWDLGEIIWPLTFPLNTVTHKCICDVFTPDYVVVYFASAVDLYDLISLQTARNTRSSSAVTLARPPTRSSLKITSCSFLHASPYLWNQLPHSLRQPRPDLPLPDSFLLHNHLTSRVIYHPVILPFQTQNFPISQILPSIDIWHLFGLISRITALRPFFCFSFFLVFS